MNTPWTYIPSGSDDPWDAGDYRVIDSGGEDIFLDTAYYPVAPDRDEAAHIVKCVNAHDKLVEALRYADTRAISRAAYPHSSIEDRKLRDLIDAALESLE